MWTVVEARGQGHTHLKCHSGPIRKLAPIWSIEGPCLLCLSDHNEGDVDLQVAGLWQGRLLPEWERLIK